MRSRIAEFLEGRVRPRGRITRGRFLFILLVGPLPLMALWLFVAPSDTAVAMPLLYVFLSFAAWYAGTLRLNDSNAGVWMNWNGWLLCNLAIGPLAFAGGNLLTSQIRSVLVPSLFLGALYFGIRALPGLFRSSEPRLNKYGPLPHEVQK